MRRYAVVSLVGCCAALAQAGAYDYYECVSPEGRLSYSVERCPRGDESRRIADNLRPVSFKLGEGRDQLIRLASGRGGHFYATATINGVPLRVLVDTGATSVAVSPAFAARAGLDRMAFRSGFSQTANGVTPVRIVTAAEVELGGSVVREVPVTILSKSLGGEDALLGMSFLKHFEINMADGMMTLRRK